VTCTRATTGGCARSRPRGSEHRLIGSLSSYGRINPFGFIETPYRRSWEARSPTRSTTSRPTRRTPRHRTGERAAVCERGFANASVLVRRKGGEVDSVPPTEVDYMECPQADHLVRQPSSRSSSTTTRTGSHGREHAASGRAPAPVGGAARRHRRGVPGGRGRGRRRLAEEAGVVEDVAADRS